MNKKEQDRILTRRIVRGLDWMFGASMFMFMFMRVVVLLAFSIKSEQTGASIEAVHTNYETNPIFKALLRLRGANYIIQFLLIPSLACTLYVTFRRKVLYNDYPIDILQHHVSFTFFLMVFNIINDTATLAGMLLGG